MAVPSHAAASPWVSAAIRRAAVIVASVLCLAKNTADVVDRMRAPLPAAWPCSWNCSAAARFHGSPLVSTACVWRPMSWGPAPAQRWKRAKMSGRSSPPRSSSDWARWTAIWVSSVASPGSQPPPPLISPSPAENRPAGPNSNGAPSASPTADPTTAPTTRSRRRMPPA
ncbi:hypothetical protein A4R43_13010 [Amycolatopsis albispora]|uniref:Uncharacterized protein n=1 Tax=Amycolatopsis albispora TaxID=1804986 RepID=A0A344L5N2_9PSEU|nr:hypothetical protein A4R43_13010 [Amycolatopsis albispora]